MQTLIRKAVAEDATQIWATRNAAILAQCVDYYSDSDLKTWTSGFPTDRFVESVIDKWHVAVASQAVVGTGIVDSVTGYLDAIFVRPDMMRRGIGTKMMAYLEQIAVERRLTSLTLDSTLNAAAFYRRCGFIGEQISEYKSPRGISLACIPMTKELAGA